MSKLIRQKIDVAPTRTRPTRDHEELMTLLRAKLLEEAFELGKESAAVFDDQALLAEFADVYEVLNALAEMHGFDRDDVRNAVVKKRDDRGGFLPGRVYT